MPDPSPTHVSGQPRGIRLSRTLGRFWTIPNGLSLLRLALVVPLTYLIWMQGPLAWIFGLVVFGALTDWVDGRVARWSKSVSGWGKVLDPLADKFAAVMVISALTLRGVEPTLPLWFLALVVGRDLCIVAGGAIIARRTGQMVTSTFMGKAAVASIALTCLAVILNADPPVLQFCVWMSTALLVASFVIYMGRYFWVDRMGTLPADARRESEPLREIERENGRTGEQEASLSTMPNGSDKKQEVSSKNSLPLQP